MDLSKFTISGEQAKINTIKMQNGRLILLRWFYVTSLPWLGSLANYYAGENDLAVKFFVVGVVGIAINGLFYICHRFLPNRAVAHEILMLVQILFDLSLAALATYLTGGPDARTTAVFALPIVASGLLFKKQIVYFTGAVSGIAYSSAVLLYSFNNPGPNSVILIPIIFYPIFFMLLAHLVSSLNKKSELDTAEKAYDSFLSLLSHQLKRPLSTTNAIFDLLTEFESSASEKQKKYVKMLQSENDHLILLINNLLEAAGATNMSIKQEVNIVKLLNESSQAALKDSNNDKKIELNISTDKSLLHGNPERLKYAFMNVLNNAFTYGTKGSDVHVSCHKSNKTIIITITNAYESPHSKKKIIPLKFTGTDDSSIQGLGLGLYAAKKIINAHNGTLNVLTEKKEVRVIITLKTGGNDE